MAQTNTEKHILNAAERIEGTVATIKEVMSTFSDRYKVLLAENATLRASHPNPPDTTPPENLDEEFASLEQALTDMERAGGSMRAAASAFANSGQTDAQVGLGTNPTTATPPLGTQDTQGQPPAPVSLTESGTQETGPSGASLPPSTSVTETQVDPGSSFPGSPTPGSDAVPADSGVAQGGPQESPDVASDPLSETDPSDTGD